MPDAGNTVYRKMKSIHRKSTGISSPQTPGGDKLNAYESSTGPGMTPLPRLTSLHPMSQRFGAGWAPLLSLLSHTFL